MMERFLLTQKELPLSGFSDHGSDVVLLCEVMMFLNDFFPEGGGDVGSFTVYPQQILGRTPVSHLDLISVISIYQWSIRSLTIGGVQSFIYSSYIYMHLSLNLTIFSSFVQNTYMHM